MRHGIVLLPEQRWSAARDRWRRAEELGFDHAWTYDHLMWRWLRDETWFGCLPTLTAAAGVTSKMRLGSLVATPTFRHPVPFAKELMTLDDISGGRLICGVGSGAGGYDESVFGAGQEGSRTGRFAEFLELTDLLLRQPVTSYEGQYYRCDGARMVPGCVQRPRLPFAVAATGPKAMGLAARYAETWITAGAPGRFDARRWDLVVPELKDQLRAFEDACAAAGRDPASAGKLLVTGATVGGVLDSAQSFRDASGTFADLGFTDLVVHWPRPSEPYQGDERVLDQLDLA